MVLTHPDSDGSAAPHSHIVLGPLEPWTFSGDWTTTCALRDGPIRDFNVIARRAMWIPRVTVLRVEREMNMEVAASIVLLYCLTGSAVIEAGEPVELERDYTLMLQPAEAERARVVVTPSGAQAILIAVELSRR